MSTWQPIETAPNDTVVLVALTPHEFAFGYALVFAGELTWTRDETGEIIHPTHWMPLPDPPFSSPQTPEERT